MNIDISCNAPSVAELAKKRAIYNVCLSVAIAAACFFGLQCAQSLANEASKELALAYYVASSLCLAVGVYMAWRFHVGKLFAAIPSNYCDNVLAWKAKHTAISHYVEQVRAQKRELVYMEYEAFVSHVNKAARSAKHHELYQG